MKFVCFDGCAGWLHDAPGARGVVIVPPHGFEDLCCRHAFRILADRLAEAGMPVLRFDLSGCGDAAGGDDDPDRVATWLGNVGAATEWMRRETGVTEITLVGIRLGALLALAALPRIGRLAAIGRLVLVAPPQSGKAYVRENAILAQMLALPTPPPAAEPDADGISVAGFRLGGGTISDLKALSAGAAPIADLAEVLIMSPEGSRVSAQLLAKLEGGGAVVTQTAFRGYQSMMADPTASVVPDAALGDVVAWIAAGAPAPRAARPAVSNGRLARDGWVERGVSLGPERAGAGIVCAPDTGAGRRRQGARGATRKGVIFINAGGVYHIGWARMYVDMARRLAADGVTSLRMDLPGIGDATAWSGSGRMTFYDPSGPHVGAAIDLMAREGVDEITLLGGCSGAHHAFHTAVSDSRVRGLVLFNMLCFVWGPSYAIPLQAWRMSKPQEIAARQRVANLGGPAPGLTARLADEALRRARRLARRTLDTFETVLRAVADPVRKRLGGVNEVEDAFRTLSGRGASIRLVYSENDAGRVELERYMGPGGRRATGLAGVDIHLLPHADHALTPIGARRALEAILRASLDVPIEDAPRAAPVGARPSVAA